MTPEATTCHGQFADGCGAPVVEYPHNLNEPLVLALIRFLAVFGHGPGNPTSLGLTHNQLANWQKLRYFDLIEQVEVDGKRNKGVWIITPKGHAFLDGQEAVRTPAWTYRAERVRWGDGLVTIRSVLGLGYKQREEWAAEAVPHP